MPLGDPREVGWAALHELAGALATCELAVADDHRAARQDDVRFAPGRSGPRSTSSRRPCGGSSPRSCASGSGRRRRGPRPPRRDCALPGVHPEQLGRRRRDDLDPALAGDLPADDAAVVEQVDPVLDAGQAVGDLPEVALAEVLLAFEVERAMVGRDQLEVVLDEARPEVGSQWSFVRSGGEQTNFAPSKPLPRSSSERNRYWGHVSAKAGRPSSRARDLLERLLRRQVDDVDGHVGGLGQADDPVGRLALEDRLTGEPVTDRVGRAGLDGLVRDDVDRQAVLGVHHDQPAVLLRSAASPGRSPRRR